MIKTTKHIIKYNTKIKNNYLERLYSDYIDCLRIYIDKILSGELELKKYITSKNLPFVNEIERKQWNAIIYKHASEIIRTVKKKYENRRFKRYQKVYSYFSREKRQLNFLNKRYSELKLNNKLKINLKKVKLNLDANLFDYVTVNGEFNEFIQVKLPYKHEEKVSRYNYININLPIKYHKQSLKYSLNDWKRKNTISIFKDNKNRFNIILYWEKEIEKRETGEYLGIDIGYKKLIADSNNNIYGKELVNIYERISNKKQGSKKFKKLLIERDKKINEICNKIEFRNTKQLFVEDLKNVKHGKSFKFMNKLQRWSYPKVLNKLENFCEENGILFTKVSPSYTSQICSNCGNLDKDARNGEIYKCKSCGIEIDADINASINILHRGVYNLSTQEN